MFSAALSPQAGTAGQAAEALLAALAGIMGQLTWVKVFCSGDLRHLRCYSRIAGRRT